MIVPRQLTPSGQSAWRLMILRMFLICVVLVPGLPVWATDTVRFDFESGNLQGWRVAEGAFDCLVSDKEYFRNRPAVKYNKKGAYFLSTLELRNGNGSDRMTGVVESPVFVITGPKMSMVVGGGNHSNTYVALYTLDGKERFRATGKRDETMVPIEWDVSGLLGQKVFLKVVDNNTGGWGHITLDDFAAMGRIDEQATKHHREQYRRKHFEKVRGLLQIEMEHLLQAVTDLTETFGGKYVHGDKFLSELQAIHKELDRQNVDAESLRETFEALKRRALIANPLVSGQPILFVVRKQYRSDHHNTATIFQTGEINTGSFTGGASLKTFDPTDGRTHTLLETRDGVIRDPEVYFDGGRIIFAMRKDIKDNYHIYEINGDGTGLRQLTFAAGISDIDPLYMADDSIVFSSTREPKYCMCNRHIMANLFRMEADGANIHQIGKSTLFEGHGSLMPDGRIMYYRWEYIDRNFGDAQGLWTVNPDGTNHAVYWGNNTNSPGAVIDARVIDGTHRVICTFSSCHDRPWGALAIVDRRLGLDGRGPVVRTWPADAVELVDKGGFDMFTRVNPKYEDPWPLSDKYFLCSRMTGHGEQMGIYLLDVFGNEILLYVEGDGCFDPMPLAPRPRPGVIPHRRDFENKTGYMYVVDVHKGTHMKGVEPGSVKFLRVVESPEKRFWVPRFGWGGQGQEDPAVAWHDFNNKRIIGTVPVEKDGSVYFELPADTWVYFQLLDENGMMIQSMRSGVIAQSGERAGCVGCHDHRHTAPVPIKSEIPLALRKAPRVLSPWYGPPRLFEYINEVQPVFDKHCVRCHDYGKDAGRKLNLAADRTNTFNTSYNELWRKKYIKAIGAGPDKTQQAYTWGSHKSRLVETIRKGHEDVKLDKESFDRIVTWIDINSPYYARYDSSYPHNLSGRSPLDGAQIKRLTELTGVPFAKLASHNGNRGPQVSFDRPGLSPCLAIFEETTDPRYAEALAIISAGAKMLKEKPRADMPGFVAWEVDRQRQEKYVSRQEIESRNRLAIRTGQRAYDRP